MSESLYLTTETRTEYERSLDNLYIAKAMYDYGKPLPPDTRFYAMYPCSVLSDTILFKALARLYDGPVCMEGDEEEMWEDGALVKVCVRQLQLWHVLKTKLPQYEEQMKADEREAGSCLQKLSCDVHDFEVEATIQPYGLDLLFKGSEYGRCSTFFSDFLTFRDQLASTIAKWQTILQQEERKYHAKSRNKHTA